MDHEKRKVVNIYGISVFFEYLLYFLTIGLIFESAWEIIFQKTPLNLWIAVAYILPPIYIAWIKAEEFSKTEFDITKEKLKIKKKMETTQRRLWLIVFFGIIFFLFKIWTLS